MTGFKVDILKADQLGEAEWGAWRAFLAANPALNSPYFRPSFTRVAAQMKSFREMPPTSCVEKCSSQLG